MSENQKTLLQQALDMLEEQALHIEAPMLPDGEELLNRIRAAISQQAEPAPAQGEPPQSGITIEKDVFGTVHIKLGDFDYIQIQYQYPYTDNASQNALAKRIAELLTRPAQTEQQPVAWVSSGPDGVEADWYPGKGLDTLPIGAKLYADPIAQTAPQHPDDEAVDRFATAMKVKLAAARAKGRGGWDDPSVCSVEFLAQLLVEHLGKGNAGTFEDVANFAMMLHQRGADPMVLAEAAEAPIKKARGEALELGVRALESKSEHTEPAPAQDEREAKAWPALAGIGRDSGHPRAVVLYLRHEPSDEHLRMIQEALRTRPAQTEQQPCHVCEDLEPDARRYRTLRQMHWNDGPLAVVANPQETVKLGVDCPSGERLDQMLDQIDEQRYPR